MINFAAAGYELAPVTSDLYNAANQLWYEKFIPTRWRPITRNCDGAIIGPTEGHRFLSIKLRTGVITTLVPGFTINYSLADYRDNRSQLPSNGMRYQNTDICNCSVTLISLTQSLSDVVHDEV